MREGSSFAYTLALSLVRPADLLFALLVHQQQLLPVPTVPATASCVCTACRAKPTCWAGTVPLL
jgi:hypothetical protein